jgi:PKD repeat protein
VANNPPVVESVNADGVEVIRTQEITLKVKGSDIEDGVNDLVLEARMSPSGKDTWTIGAVTSIQWSDAYSAWVVVIRPDAHAQLGDYALRLRLTDSEEGVGDWYDFDRPIKVLNGLPVIDLDYPDVVNEKEAVVFDATGSYDPEGGSIQFSWEFGDGGTDTSDRPTHTYAKARSYTLTLTVMDIDGAEVVSTMNIAVNALPIGVIKATQETGYNNFAVGFDATGTRDPDGNVATYRWDFDLDKDTNGDGNPTNDIDSTDRNPTFDYAAPGTYSYKLTIVDDKGATVEVRDKVTVSSMSTMTAGIIGGVFLLVIVAALVALVLMKRKRKGSAVQRFSVPPPKGGGPGGQSLTDVEDENLGLDPTTRL